jgi:folylpolyglutamate synthase/dihydropteroate synthase
MSDKDVDGILAALLPVTGDVITTQAPGRRALPSHDLASRVRVVDPSRRVVAVAEPLAAVQRALTTADVVCVAGSIYLAGVVREPLMQRAMLP